MSGGPGGPDSGSPKSSGPRGPDPSDLKSSSPGGPDSGGPKSTGPRGLHSDGSRAPKSSLMVLKDPNLVVSNPVVLEDQSPVVSSLVFLDDPTMVIPNPLVQEDQTPVVPELLSPVAPEHPSQVISSPVVLEDPTLVVPNPLVQEDQTPVVPELLSPVAPEHQTLVVPNPLVQEDLTPVVPEHLSPEAPEHPSPVISSPVVLEDPTLVVPNPLFQDDQTPVVPENLSPVASSSVVLEEMSLVVPKPVDLEDPSSVVPNPVVPSHPAVPEPARSPSHGQGGHPFYTTVDYSLSLSPATTCLNCVSPHRRRKDTEAAFTVDNLACITVDLFKAGTQTMTDTLRWALLLMIKYPQIQKKVQDEIDCVIGKSRQPCLVDRASMPYTDAVIHETQRVSNILPLIAPRLTSRDSVLAGYFIPKGTMVICNLSSVLKDSSQWEKPDQFYPEHFLDDQRNFRKREAFYPFSAGKRSCLGEQLARNTLFLFFTSLLQRFSFSPPEGLEPCLEAQEKVKTCLKPFRICVSLR